MKKTIILVTMAIIIGGGLWLWQQQSKNIVQKNDNDQIKDWQTYNNEELAFEMQYPKDWKYSNSNIYGNSNSNYDIISFKHEDSSHFDIFPNGALGHGLPWGGIEKEITIDGKKAIETEWKSDNDSIYIIIRFSDHPNKWSSNNAIEITGLKQHANIFNEMINSIKFTE